MTGEMRATRQSPRPNSSASLRPRHNPDHLQIGHASIAACLVAILGAASAMVPTPGSVTAITPRTDYVEQFSPHPASCRCDGRRHRAELRGEALDKIFVRVRPRSAGDSLLEGRIRTPGLMIDRQRSGYSAVLLSSAMGGAWFTL